MRLKQLISDDDAVSPVIGVILMVVITVILAAVIASFVLGLGDTTETTPQASFDFDLDDSNNELTIAHEGGDTIDADRVAVKVNGTEAGDGSFNGGYKLDPSFSGDITSGTTATLTNETTSDILNAATVTVVWTSDSGDSSSTLGTWEGPNA